MPYADYGYYRNTYGGNSIDEADFPRLATRASLYIDAVTGGASRSATGTDLDAVRMATCALAETYIIDSKLDAVAFSGAAQVQSETVGGWSRSYGTRSISATDIQLADQRRKEALTIYLGGTSLLSPVGYPVTRGDSWP